CAMTRFRSSSWDERGGGGIDRDTGGAQVSRQERGCRHWGNDPLNSAPIALTACLRRWLAGGVTAEATGCIVFGLRHFPQVLQCAVTYGHCTSRTSSLWSDRSWSWQRASGS